MELAIYTGHNPKVMFFKPTSENSFTKWSEFSFEETILGNVMESFSRSDANNDAVEDLIIVPFDGTIRFLRMDATDIIQSIIGDLGNRSIHDDLIIVDLDLDGQKEILVVSRQKSGGDSFEELSVICGNNIGEFKDVVTFLTDRKSGLGSLILRTLDFDYDGVEDVAFLDDFNRQLILFKNISSVPIPTPTPTKTDIDAWFLW